MLFDVRSRGHCRQYFAFVAVIAGLFSFAMASTHPVPSFQLLEEAEDRRMEPTLGSQPSRHVLAAIFEGTCIHGGPDRA